MKTRLINLWDTFRSSFWFVPTWIVLFFLCLSLATGYLDKELAKNHLNFDLLETTAKASRSTLNSLAGALIALIGVVFSITLLTLSIASSQFGSRIIRNVMTDSIADWMIGLYIGTSLFCLMIIRTIRISVDDGYEFVPQIGTAVASMMGLICIGLLIFYIHHVAVSIQAPNLIKNVATDFYSAIDRLFPENIGKQSSDGECDHLEILNDLGDPSFEIQASKEGFIEGIDGDSLVSLAKRMNAVICLECKPGDYVTNKKSIARIWSRKNDLEESCKIHQKDDVKTEFNNALIIGANRTPRQDIGYATFELVEIASRALSPGINDPFTAMTCIDRLGGGLCRLSERSLPSQVRKDCICLFVVERRREKVAFDCLW